MAKYKIVEVYWQDPECVAGWWHHNETFNAVEETKVHHPAVGYLVADDEDYVIISFGPDVTEDDDNDPPWMGRLTIPKSDVRQIKVIKSYEKKKIT